jgi:hyperosmotically inducible protein
MIHPALARSFMERPLFAAIALVLALAGCTRERMDEVTRLEPRAGHAVAAAQSAPSAPATPSRLLPSPEMLSDPVITARIAASLVTDPAMAGADVSVNTSQGVVSLTGLVASQEQSAIASAHAQGQDGVMRVDNHLAVNLR